ncbi:hypothetical protein SAMN05421753_11959 [Planctomicrobium piriforme]|uniref:Uncharacterized protein n=2 Tax=Planctomicrobium piriforme TaxID=1576369 RepID=A0A1I3QUI1_9PLAN|nr:hypothetical protein SAMN05421753_11959 [Planctomicrobium piriforme]
MQGTLRVVVGMYCFGVAAARLHQLRPDRVVEFLGRPGNLPEGQVNQFGDLLAYGMILCGVLTLLRPISLVLIAIVVYAAAASVAGMFDDQNARAHWTPALEATRWMAPLALLLIDFWPPRVRPTLVLCLSAVGLLRMTTAAMFLAQGIICIDQCQHGGAWADLVQSVALNGFQRTIDADVSQRCLGIVGGVNFAVAACLMTSRNPVVPLLATIWGGLMAFSYTLAGARAGYDQTLLRASEWGAPLIVTIFQSLSVKDHKPDYVPEITSPPKSPGKK